MHEFWTTIDESPSAQPIILKGLPITAPKSYERVFGRKGGWFHLAAFMAGLWRVTAWSASTLAHLVLMIILVGMMFRKDDDPDQLVAVSLSKGDQGEHGKLLAMAKPDPAPEPEPEPVVEEKKEPEKKPEEQVKVEEKKEEPKVEEPVAEEKKEDTTKAEVPTEEKKNDVIGKGDGKPDAEKKDAGKDNGKPIDDATSATASRRAGDLAKLRRGGEKEIVVVAGAYDQVERVLTALAIPHTRIDHNDLGKYDLSQCLVLLVNCHTSLAKMTSSSTSNAEKMKTESERLAKRIVESEKKLEKAKTDREKRILEVEIASLRQSKSYYDRMYEYYLNAAGMQDNVRRFVEKGGYVFTSDWGITLLEKCFPDFVVNGGNYGPSNVKIQASRAEDAAKLLEGVFVKKGKPGSTTTSQDLRWEVDSGSYLIKVKSNKVVTLVESSSLPNHKAVAVAFTPAGTGRVLHVLSHFSKQEDTYGEYALQNLLLNFILERVEKKAP